MNSFHCGSYRRYHIETEVAPDRLPVPPRFRVKVRRHRLAWLLLRELFHYRGNWSVVASRPCVYGVFSGPVGGFAPREHLCVGCLRCTIQYPDVVDIVPNPERERLGDSYLTPQQVETLLHEARTGQIPVRGAGYRGPFAGAGWDSLWTDMSEIVRPTRDGIHGREYISTVVDVGRRPRYLGLDEAGRPVGELPRVFSLGLPMLLDAPPRCLAGHGPLARVLAAAASRTGTLAVLPLSTVQRQGLGGEAVVPLVAEEAVGGIEALPPGIRLCQLEGWNRESFHRFRERFPGVAVAIRLGFGPETTAHVEEALEAGVGVFHLAFDYHGRGTDGRFALEAIREVHTALVEAGRREEITLVAAGGIVAAEHVPKAILCGVDAVALDVALLVALQARLVGPCRDPATARVELSDFPLEWGTQRLLNLLSAWRDQLLEVLGAMGMREVRRMRGDMGRAMLCSDLEREAFEGIPGYDG